jgi:hypothetical protein
VYEFESDVIIDSENKSYDVNYSAISDYEPQHQVSNDDSDVRVVTKDTSYVLKRSTSTEETKSWTSQIILTLGSAGR